MFQKKYFEMLNIECDDETARRINLSLAPSQSTFCFLFGNNYVSKLFLIYIYIYMIFVIEAFFRSFFFFLYKKKIQIYLIFRPEIKNASLDSDHALK